MVYTMVYPQKIAVWTQVGKVLKFCHLINIARQSPRKLEILGSATCNVLSNMHVAKEHVQEVPRKHSFLGNPQLC